jgi:hypothetical protein
MDMKDYKQRLAEVERLEQLLKTESGISDHFITLADGHPRRFYQLVNEVSPSTINESVQKHFLQIASTVKELKERLEHYLSAFSIEESEDFRKTSEKLENVLWVKNFDREGFTHFLDIDQQCDWVEQVVECFFYRLEASKLFINITDREGLNVSEHTLTVGDFIFDVKGLLSSFLVNYFVSPGFIHQELGYMWSNVFSKKQFDEILMKANETRSLNLSRARLLAEGNDLIQYCYQEGLYPRPEGNDETKWLANCPTGGNHLILISASSNNWGCGYCKRRGGLAELRQWIDQRKEK